MEFSQARGRNFEVNIGRAVLEWNFHRLLILRGRNFEVNIGRAALEWNFHTVLILRGRNFEVNIGRVSLEWNFHTCIRAEFDVRIKRRALGRNFRC
jgi:hypothetical protein